MNKNEITIDGKVYVLKEEVCTTSVSNYKIVRSYDAGVFAGYIESIEGAKVVMRKARRIWYWSGAASLSQLATDGTSDPDNCKFPCEVSSITVFNVIEVLDVTEKAKKSIADVLVWTA